MKPRSTAARPGPVELPRRRRGHGGARLALVLVVLFFSRARPAQANFDEDLQCFIVTTLWTIPATIVDVGFAGSAINQAATGQPDRGVALAETIMMVPQLIVAPILFGQALRKHVRSRCLYGGVLLTFVLSVALFSHGIWTLSQPALVPLPPGGATLMPQLNVTPYQQNSSSFGLVWSRRF